MYVPNEDHMCIDKMNFVASYDEPICMYDSGIQQYTFIEYLDNFAVRSILSSCRFKLFPALHAFFIS